MIVAGEVEMNKKNRNQFKLKDRSKPKDPNGNKKRKWTVRRATELRDNLPRSEQWFNSELKKRKVFVKLESNIEMFGKIPDYVSKLYKFVIEIDGSVHETCEQIAKDKKKDKIYRKNGYDVIRIIAYDSVSLDKGIEAMFARIRKMKMKMSDDYDRAKKGRKKVSAKTSKKLTDRYCRVSGKRCQLCKSCEGTEVVPFKGRRFYYCQTCRPKVLV